MELRYFLLFFIHEEFEYKLPIKIINGWETLYTGTFKNMPNTIKDMVIEWERVKIVPFEENEYGLLIDVQEDPIYCI